MAALTLVRHRETADAVRLATGMLASPAEQQVDVLERDAPRMTAIALRFATERLEPVERARLRAARVA